MTTYFLCVRREIGVWRKIALAADASRTLEKARQAALTALKSSNADERKNAEKREWRGRLGLPEVVETGGKLAILDHVQLQFRQKIYSVKRENGQCLYAVLSFLTAPAGSTITQAQYNEIINVFTSLIPQMSTTGERATRRRGDLM